VITGNNMIWQVSSLSRYVQKDFALLLFLEIRNTVLCSKESRMELTGRQQRVKEAGEGFGKNSDVRVIISGGSLPSMEYLRIE